MRGWLLGAFGVLILGFGLSRHNVFTAQPQTPESLLSLPKADVEDNAPFTSDISQVRKTPQSPLQIQLSYSPVVKQTAPAVVNVYTSRTLQRRRHSDFFDFMFGLQRAPQKRVQNSLGSGVIVRTNGIIVTNAHVIKNAEALKVVLNDRREYNAEIIAQDEKIDVAVLRIDTHGERLPTLPVRGDNTLEIGDIVLAIGNPFGVGQTVTSGIVSALGRTNVTNISSYIQTDAAVNPGNSGGALVNLTGELVGINTAIFSRSGGSNGIGFAIPAELVARAVESALSEGRILRPWIGARTQGLDTTMATALGLDRAQGAIINDIYPDGPADKAGLKERDVILAINDTPIHDDSGLRFKLATFPSGKNIRIKIWRNGHEQNVRATVDIPQEIPPRNELDLAGYHGLNGTTIANLSPVIAEELDVDPYLSGVMITKITRRSAAHGNGLRPGDILIQMNDQAITSTAHCMEFLSQLDNPQTLRLSIDRNGRIYDVPIRYLPRHTTTQGEKF